MILKHVYKIEFLRTNYPDVDVPFDLLQEEIYADNKELNEFDPYQGNQIAQLPLLDKNQCVLDFICTPVGETGSELSKHAKALFIPKLSSQYRRISHPCSELWAHFQFYYFIDTLNEIRHSH